MASTGPRQLSGVVPPLITPFTEDGEVDHASLRSLCRFLLDRGVHGLYPCGTSGEFVLLTADERRAVAETVLETVAGSVPVYIHVGAAGTAEALALARHARAAGADGIGAITPFFHAHEDEALRRHYLTIAGAVAPLPLYLYNLPSHARNAISPDLASRLAALMPNIVGIKDSSGTLASLQSFCALPAFSVLSGSDGLNLAALLAGCGGMISGNANAAPEPFIEVWQAWQAGDLAAAELAQAKIDAVRSVLSDGARLADFKAVLVARGVLRSAAVRAPLAPARDGRDLWAKIARVSSTAAGTAARESGAH